MLHRLLVVIHIIEVMLWDMIGGWLDITGQWCRSRTKLCNMKRTEQRVAIFSFLQMITGLSFLRLSCKQFEHLKNTSQVLNPTPPTTPTWPKRSVHQLYHTYCTRGTNMLNSQTITNCIKFLGHNWNGHHCVLKNSGQCGHAYRQSESLWSFGWI